MFKPTRKRVVKAKEKITFKLEFHVTNVPQQRWDKLLVSLVYLETGKVTSKTGKAPVKNGTCQWADALLESVFISPENNGKDASKESYKLVVSTGLSRFGVLGDVTINLGDYLQSTTPVSLSLPLQNTSSGSILHVKVQRMLPKSVSRDADDQKESLHRSFAAVMSDVDQCIEGESMRSSNDGSAHGEENPLKGDSVLLSSASQNVELVDVPSTPLIDEHRVIGREDEQRLIGREDDEFMSLTSSASSSGRHEAESGVYDGESMSPETSKPRASLSSSYSSPTPYSSSSTDALSRQDVGGNSPLASSDKIRWETSQRRTRLQRTASIAMPSSWEHDASQVAVAEIEALRQQLANEAKRSEEVHKKLSMLIAERDNIKQEMENLRVVEVPSLLNARDGDSKHHQQIEEETSLLAVKELQDELDYVKGINVNLSLQLEKTQESNSELLLEIQDLEKELEKQRSGNELQSTRMEDNDLEMNELVKSLRKELAELERDSQELTEENLEILSQLKQANDKLKQKDEIIATLQAEEAQTNFPDHLAENEADVEGGLREMLRESEEARCTIEAESQSLLDKMTKAENDHTNALEKVKNLEAAYQMLEQESGELIQTLKKQLEDTKEELLVMSKLCNDKVQAIESKETEIAELEIEMAAVLRAKEEDKASFCHLQGLNSMLEEKLQEEQLNASKLIQRCEADEANSLQLRRELDASQVQVKNMQQMMSNLELTCRDLKDELQALLEKDRLNTSQVKDFELRIAVLEDETKSLRTSKALLEVEMEEVKSSKDVLHWQKQPKGSVEENFTHLQDINAKGPRRPLEEKNTEVNEQLQKQSGDLAWKLSEKEVELQDLKMRVFYLEEELQRKVSALASAERRLKEQRDSPAHDGGNQVSYLSRSLSRANSRVGANKPTIPPLREAKELADLRSKVKLLEAEVMRKAAELEESKEQLKEQYTQFSSRIEHLELANEELLKEHSNSKLEQVLKELSSLQNQNALLCQRENELLSKVASQEALQCEIEVLKEEKKELESALSKFNAAAKGENILKRISTLETELAEVLESNLMYKTQLQSVFAKQQNVHVAALENLGSVDKVIKDLAELKKKNMALEDELCDMKERYFNMSLQFAEVEAEREELVMTIRSLRGTKKFAPLRSAIF